MLKLSSAALPAAGSGSPITTPIVANISTRLMVSALGVLAKTLPGQLTMDDQPA